MGKCFVVQPFDGAAFDKRFDGVLAPAIARAGLTAYRVDRDPAASIPIEAIEAGLRDAEACVADVSLDNPNVWFELGYAIALGVPLVLICEASRREQFPFDIQHRQVVRYHTHSPSDFAALAEAIASRLVAVVERQSKVRFLAASPLTETEGLDPHEVSALVLIAEGDLDPDTAATGHQIKDDMRKLGFTEVAAVIAVKSLLKMGFVETTEVSAFNNATYVAHRLTDTGIEWLQANKASLSLRTQRGQQGADESFEDFPEDLPF